MTGEAAPVTENKPTPDPTVLTTEQLLREISRLEKQLEQGNEAVKELLQNQIHGLSDLTKERFKSQAELAALTERQRIERKEDDRISLNAALAAAEKVIIANNEAVDKANAKTEKANADQLGQLSVTFTTALAGIQAGQQADRTRIERIENIKAGGSQNTTSIYQFLGAAVAVITIVAVLYALLKP